jgi:alpha-beta hydrolase superfamily lysophospholipase
MIPRRLASGPPLGFIMVRPLFRILVSILASVLLGLAVLAVGAYAWFLRSGPQPRVWHTAHLEQEFTAAKADEVRTIADYRALEDRLFAELGTDVLDRLGPDERTLFNRFNAGSRSDPGIWATNWNRTFEIRPPQPVGAALLLHGLTDSPYSLRSIGEHLASRGLEVVGLRLPGHGTAPSGLVDFEVEDMQAAVRLAMRDLRQRMGPDRPVYLVGYSNGAALAVDYTLGVIEGSGLPRPAGLVLFSPAIGISPFAVVARLKTGLSSVPGFERAAWQEIVGEFDPYKYSSFSFNAAGQTERLTSEVAKRVRRLAGDGQLSGFPPVLAFLSTVDSTVRAEAVVDVLLEHLAAERHELVLFDVNRLDAARALLIADPGPLTARLLAMPARTFTLTVITNENAETEQVLELTAAAGAATQASRPLGLAWPRTVFSLAHVALPFPPDDPLYGYEAPTGANHVQLGRVSMHGENGVLTIPDWVLTRQRSNPFHAYALERIDGFIGAPASEPLP